MIHFTKDPMIAKDQLKWFVAYTMPRTEKKVAEGISARGIETFLPLYKVIRQWSDRKKRMELPLFPNYLFVKADEISRLGLFPIKGLIRFVSVGQRPVTIKEEEIETIKRVIKEEYEIAPEQFFSPGTPVKITRGQFAGLQGVVVRNNGRTRFVIRLHSIMRAYSLNLSGSLFESISCLSEFEGVVRR
jgi:transcription antitermination factor NusG